jgi:hypothetical protein
MAETGTAPRSAPPASGRSEIRPEILILLVAISLFLVFLALEPFLSYALFGSDTGEYYRLTSDLIATGSLPQGSAYTGWGTAYPDFPGIFLLAGAGAEGLGLSPFDALTVLVPVVAVLSFLPLFLLFRRLYPNDTVALLGAALASVAMPRLFSIAHPAPLALGDFLCVAALWMLVESRTDVRWYLPLTLVGGALIVTHHLSSYFFAVSALGGIVFLELWRPGLWSRRFPTRELAFVAAFVTATFAFWFYGTSSFVSTVLLPGLGHASYVGFAALEGIALAIIVVAALLLRIRRARFRPVRAWVRLPTDRSAMIDMVWLAVVCFGAAALVIVIPVPGTSQVTSPATVLWFAPLLAFGVLCAGVRRTPRVARLGPFALTWTGGLGLSAGVMLVLSEVGTALGQTTLQNFAATIAPERHVEYLLIPIALLVAISTARWVARAHDTRGRRAMTAAVLGVVVLVAANAAIVYPPQTDFGGFEEGLTPADAALWMWVGIAAPPTWTVASDHRLSSMIFGFDGNPATWVTTPNLFNGNSWAGAASELRSVGVPNPAEPKAIDLVAVDSVMYSGVALDPAKLAIPLSAAAIAWFERAPFVPLYEDGTNVVYLVDATEFPAA